MLSLTPALSPSIVEGAAVGASRRWAVEMLLAVDPEWGLLTGSKVRPSSRQFGLDAREGVPFSPCELSAALWP